MKFTALLATLAGTALAHPTEPLAERAVAAKYFDPTLNLTYNEWVSPGQAVYRIAIPSTATAAPFDIAFQIVAPKAVTWAAISWGGGMTNAPISIGWANGNNVTVSARYATSYMLPRVYADATHRVLSNNAANATHWTLSGVCTGCSKWAAKSITPGASVGLAWAVGNRAVTNPADPASNFAVHSAKGKFTFDFTAARAPEFATATAPK